MISITSGRMTERLLCVASFSISYTSFILLPIIEIVPASSLCLLEKQDDFDDLSLSYSENRLSLPQLLRYFNGNEENELLTLPVFVVLPISELFPHSMHGILLSVENGSEESRGASLPEDLFCNGGVQQYVPQVMSKYALQTICTLETHCSDDGETHLVRYRIMSSIRR